MISKLTEDNYLNFALKNCKSCINVNSVKEELRLVTQVFILLKKYKKTDKINIRMVLNYFIISNNTFGKFSSELFLFKIPEFYYPELLVFLDYLYIIPNNYDNVNRNQDLIQKLKDI